MGVKFKVKKRYVTLEWPHYPFGANHTVDITDGKFKNQALCSGDSEISAYSEIFLCV